MDSSAVGSGHSDRIDSPVFTPEAREQLADACTEATSVTLREWAGIEVSHCEVTSEPLTSTAGHVTAWLDLGSATLCALVLRFPERTAASFAERVLREVGTAVDGAMIRDCVGELANVIGGQAKALLHGTVHHIVFSTPTVTSGADGYCPTGGEGLVIRFDTDVGAFALQVIPRS
jgi:CheY-specific phosphatase CheX